MLISNVAVVAGVTRVATSYLRNFSIAVATASTWSSRPGLPTTCSPIGSPAFFSDEWWPHGTETMGKGDAKFQIDVMSSV